MVVDVMDGLDVGSAVLDGAAENTARDPRVAVLEALDQRLGSTPGTRRLGTGGAWRSFSRFLESEAQGTEKEGEQTHGQRYDSTAFPYPGRDRQGAG